VFAYCTECRAPVTVRSDRCLLGHAVDVSRAIVGRGRHISPAGRPPRDSHNRTRQRVKALVAAGPRQYGVIELLGMGERESDWPDTAIALEEPTVEVATPTAPEPPPKEASTELDWGPDSLRAAIKNGLAGRRWLVMCVLVGLVTFISLNALTNRPQPGEVTIAEELSATIEMVSADLEALVSVMVNLDQPDQPVADAADILAKLETTSLALGARTVENSDPDLDQLLAGIDELHSRLGDALTYRLLTGELAAIPALPSSAEHSVVSALTPELAAWASQRQDLLNSLPEIEALADHRLKAEEYVVSLESWIADYVGALTDEKPKTAGKLIRRLERQTAELDRLLAEGLRRIAAEAEAIHGEVAQLASLLA